jgi:hypothetical protein
VKDSIADGSTDIVVGTHTLLGRKIAFDRLGLLVVVSIVSHCYTVLVSISTVQ